jgi:hypothetical protein
MKNHRPAMGGEEVVLRQIAFHGACATVSE